MLADFATKWSELQNLHPIPGIHHRPISELPAICQLQPLAHILDTAFVWNISLEIASVLKLITGDERKFEASQFQDHHSIPSQIMHREIC